MKSNLIRLSCDPISIDSTINEFNKNIISIKLKDFLESASELKLNENEKAKCNYCSSFFSSCSKVEKNLSTWCEICKKLNTLDFKEIDIEFIKNQISSESMKEKIIVFCIDISGSMSGKRIETVKTACLKTLELLREKNPDYIVAIISFETSGVYYGDGRLMEQTVSLANKTNVLDSKNELMRIQESFKKLLPIKYSYSNLVDLIKNKLNGGGGTSICSALTHSVYLASALYNSEIILCTDGCADDKSEQFYDSVIQFCNQNGFIRINIISFDDADCDLFLLGKLASGTNGKISKTSDSVIFNSFFTNVIEKSTQHTLRGSVNLTILTDMNFILFENNISKIEMKNIDKNNNELLFEYKIRRNGEIPDFVCFQFQFDSDNSTRVYSVKVKVDKSKKNHAQNAKIIHAYYLRKLSRVIYDEKNLIKAKTILEAYSNFVKINKHENLKLVKETCDLINQLRSTNLNDQQAEIIHNNKNRCSDEIADLVGYDEIKANIIDYDEMKELNDLNEKNLESIINNFRDEGKKEIENYCQRLEDLLKNWKKDSRDKINLLVALVLMKQAYYLVHIVKCTLNNNKENDDLFLNKNNLTEKISDSHYLENQNIIAELKKENDKDLIDNILLKLENLKIIFDDLNNIVSNSIKEENELFDELLKELFVLINGLKKVTNLNQIEAIFFQKAKQLTANIQIVQSFKNKVNEDDNEKVKEDDDENNEGKEENDDVLEGIETKIGRAHV